jgi:hypothetical protein
VPKSHIVPEYLYEHTREGGQILVVDENVDQIGPPRQKGYYEPLLCAACESEFNTKWEQPCQKFFRSMPVRVRIGETIDVHLPEELRGLVLSMFWRAAHAQDSSWRAFRSGFDVDRVRRVLDGAEDPYLLSACRESDAAWACAHR